MAYDFAAIEPKWQELWEAEGVFRVTEDETRPKFYNVQMYPYPSGELHMGHLRNYTYVDLLTRYHRMRGKNVLSPMGWDSFGLPAENAAIQTGVHPREFTERQIVTMKAQLRRLGAVYDWTREIASHTPEFYKWDQWLFLQLFDQGLAYKKRALVNWCPKDQTVLANEQVVDGACERCGTVVIRRDLEQWFFKITDYAERLLDDLATLDEWPERVRVMQKNWIGRSEGCQFRMEVAGTDLNFEVFTTRPDTVFGMTFAVLAPEHPLVDQLIAGSATESEARAYIEQAARQSEIERLAEGDKSGVFTGRSAINPVNGRLVPIYIADYVLTGYGTGAIMAVPGQDDRDWEFAEKYGLEIIRTVEPPSDWVGKAYTGDGPAINSDFLDGLDMAAAKQRIIEWFEGRGIGRGTIQYRLRDWLISRQRYWGSPIPIVICPDDGLVPVPEDQLPVMHPDVADYAPQGQSPLASVPEFVNVQCPKCGGPAERETDTMDTFVDSSWYYLRYCDPHDASRIFDPAAVRYWMPVDQYVGGVEHAVLHLLYARFITKVLHDMGLVDVEEPFARLFTQGMLVKDGAKMSKSKGNVVSPDAYYARYGADAIRLFELFIGPPTDDAIWNDNGVEGTFRFLDRVWRMGTGEIGRLVDRDENPGDREVLAITHRAVKKVTEDIERFRFNTAVAALMGLANSLIDYLNSDEGGRRATFDEAFRLMILMLAPMAPHMTHELWERSGRGAMLAVEKWPEWDPELVRQETVTMIVQVNGKVRDRIEVAADIDAVEAEKVALESAKIRAHLDGKKIEKVVVRPPNLVNVVVNQ
ncbi:MAG TPA: leucine--tRNA ligase [Acidimicrobiia bacterium]|nr:leucine--tRNA ligase [Acidimicrobiia bacterium]